jgi:serine/threonine protein kinase
MTQLERRGPLARTYTDFTLVGEGGFGKVYRCRRKDTGQIVALKETINELTDESKQAIANEARITQLLSNCPHGSEDLGCRFNHTMGAFLSPDKNNVLRAYIEMDYIDGVEAGDLLDEYQVSAADFTTFKQAAEAIRRRFIHLTKEFYPLLLTLHNFHSHGIVLNDLHLGNVMWDEANDRFLLIDFGLAVVAAESQFALLVKEDTAKLLGVLSRLLLKEAMLTETNPKSVSGVFTSLGVSFSVNSVENVWCYMLIKYWNLYTEKPVPSIPSTIRAIARKSPFQLEYPS